MLHVKCLFILSLSTCVSCLCVVGIPGGSEADVCKERITNIDTLL